MKVEIPIPPLTQEQRALLERVIQLVHADNLGENVTVLTINLTTGEHEVVSRTARARQPERRRARAARLRLVDGGAR